MLLHDPCIVYLCLLDWAILGSLADEKKHGAYGMGMPLSVSGKLLYDVLCSLILDSSREHFFQTTNETKTMEKDQETSTFLLSVEEGV